MKAGYTPGPWEAVFADVPYGELGEAWTVDGVFHSICTVDSPKAHAEANARLIAAAPCLVEALRMVLDEGHSYESEGMARDHARALLARIDGDPA